VKVSEALDNIRKFDLVLPEFQREYVWTKEQAKQLLVSLIRGYPVGGLLFWRTDSPPELKNVTRLPDKLGSVLILLDGQQRLTTLHMFLTGQIPAFYTAAEIENDPRDLHYNLNTGELQYYQASKMRDDPYWQRVVDCFRPDGVSEYDIVKKKNLDGQAAFDLAKMLSTHLNAVRNIPNVDLPEQIVPSQATLDEAIDIFDRVNSQGTKLTDAELALTHVTSKWSLARREMKAKMEECAERDFEFGLTFMTRALTTTVTSRALFETVHDRPATELREGWDKVKRILDYLTAFLPQQAYIHSTADLNTTNALIPLVAYLSLNDGKFPSQESVKHAINWLYAALMWARYTSQTDQRLEADVSLVSKDTLPWEALRSQIRDQRGRIEVEPSDFAGRGAQSPFYRATFILAKAHNAIDWFNGLPIAKTHGKAYGIHSHHIFPQGVLYKNGFDRDDYTHRQLVNEIANRAFLTAESNVSLSDRLPEEYLPLVEKQYPGALASQFVPMDPGLWKVERYRDFLAARRASIARKLNEFMTSLISKPEETRHRPIAELIKLGEGYTLEFKSTLQWDVVQRRQNTHLRKNVLKTVAAFMNSEGGTLVVGVEDDGTVLGIEQDLKLTKQSLDAFENLLLSSLGESLGAGLAPLFRVRFEGVNGKQVCVVDVERSPEPVFADEEGKKTFYVRLGNTTRNLDPEETHRYIEMNWN